MLAQPGIKAPDLSQGQVRDLPRAVGGSGQVGVVYNHQPAIPAEMHVHLEHGGAHSDGTLEGAQGVFRLQGGSSPVRDDVDHGFCPYLWIRST